MRITIVLLSAALLIYTEISNAQPEVQWVRTYGTEGTEQCRKVIQTTSGGFALVGYSISYTPWEMIPRYNGMFVITNEVGRALFTQIYTSGEDDGYDYLNNIIQTNDGGFAMVGYTDSNENGPGGHWLVRVDEGGEELWSRTYGRGLCYSTVQTEDGGFLLAGNGGGVPYLVKTDSDGNVDWEQLYDVTAFNTAIQIDDGSFVFAGGTEGDYLLTKLDEDGEEIWSHTYGSEEEIEHCLTMIQTADGGFLLAGLFVRNDNLNYWVVRTDSDGEEVWTQTFVEGMHWGDTYVSVIQTADGGYALGGMSTENRGDFLLVRMDEDGEELWSQSYGGDEYDWFTSLTQSDDGSFLMAGLTESYGDNLGDMILIKTEPDPVSVPFIVDPALPSRITLNPPYPNPFNSITNIRYGLPSAGNVIIQLFNPLGQQINMVLEGYKLAGNHVTILNAEELSTGLYFVRLQASDQVLTQKVMLIK